MKIVLSHLRNTLIDLKIFEISLIDSFHHNLPNISASSFLFLQHHDNPVMCPMKGLQRSPGGAHGLDLRQELYFSPYLPIGISAYQ